RVHVHLCPTFRVGQAEGQTMCGVARVETWLGSSLTLRGLSSLAKWMSLGMPLSVALIEKERPRTVPRKRPPTAEFRSLRRYGLCNGDQSLRRGPLYGCRMRSGYW